MSESFIDKKNRIHAILPDLLDNLHGQLIDKIFLTINMNNNNPDFNIIFNISKKIYESYNTHFISNNTYNNNYVLKFVENLNNQESNYIIDLFNNITTKKIKDNFINLFQEIYNESNSIDMYSILSSYTTNISIKDLDFLSPENEQSQYIKFPDDKSPFLNKKYVLMLFYYYYCTIININSNKMIKLNFFKKILSKNKWEKFIDYINDNEEINNYTKGNDEIIITDCFGKLCNYNFNKFINTISNEIIKEENKNISKIKNELNSAQNIVDLFKIYYIIQQTPTLP
jgi:hypothetical protein